MIHARGDYNRIQDPEGKIPIAEPVFLIRAQDKVGADAVRAWAKLNQAAGGDFHLTAMAFRHATNMDNWPTKKLADMPVDEAADLCTS